MISEQFGDISYIFQHDRAPCYIKSADIVV